MKCAEQPLYAHHMHSLTLQCVYPFRSVWSGDLTLLQATPILQFSFKTITNWDEALACIRGRRSGAHPLCFKAQAVLQRLCISLSVLTAPRQVVHLCAQACCLLLQLVTLLLQMELCLHTPGTHPPSNNCSVCTKWHSRQRILLLSSAVSR